ncbi:MAG: hypothetical protein KatS3mg100_575 [Candidatus Parcubacteria bacterium]|nr:MAG: hypothetical protein KatS3mg100_575 [Candidatus Parcubacteria bacterium]
MALELTNQQQEGSANILVPLPTLLTRWSDKRRAGPALVQIQVGSVSVVTYGHLPQEAARVARLLAASGVREGDRVVLWAPNSVDWVIAFLGVVWRGAIPVPVDSHAPREVAARIAQDAGALVTLQSALQSHSITTRTITLETLRSQARPLPPLPPVERPITDPLLFAYTSGTTGDPKGVVLSTKAVVANAAAAREVFDLDATTRLVSVLPLSHMFELTAGLLVPLLAGGSVVYPRAPVAGAIFEALAFGGVTHMVVVPRLLETFRKAILKKAASEGKEAMLKRLLSFSQHLPLTVRRALFFPVARRFGAPFRYFVCGGAPLSDDLQDFWHRLGFAVYEGYGLTEHSPVISTNTPTHYRAGTVGKALPGVEARVAQDGELLVRSAMIMDGYYHKPEETSKVLRDDWLATGDIASMDEERYITILGRKKDMIVTEGGFNVYPDDLEALLKKEERVVKDACVVGCRAPRGKGETVVGVIVSDASRELIEEGVARVNAQVPKPARIRQWVLWEGPFPQTPTLKTKRAKIAEEVCPALAREQTSLMPIFTHESPTAQEIASFIGDITHTDAFKDPNTWDTPLQKAAGKWGVWEWWQLLRKIEHAFYFTLPQSVITPEVTVASLARVVEERPLAHLAPLSIRRLPPTNEVALMGCTLLDTRDPETTRWIRRAGMPCVVLDVVSKAPPSALPLSLSPHPEHIAQLARLLRACKDRSLVWWVPREGQARADTIALAALVSFHSKKPMWMPRFCEGGASVLAHQSFSLAADVGEMPQWMQELVQGGGAQ